MTLLTGTEEWLGITLTMLFNFSLRRGIIPGEWKEASIIPLFKEGSKNKSENYLPVNLTSVMCKLLEENINIW